MKNDQQKEARLEELRAEMAKSAADYHELFTSPTGQRVIKDLEKRWDQELADFSNPNVTYWRLGARDLLVSIKQMIKIHEKLNGADE